LRYILRRARTPHERRDACVVAMLYSQLTHSIGLNDLCDSLGLHRGPLSAIRGATPPKRNTLSYANAHRDASLAEKLFWSVLERLSNFQPGFVGGRRRGLLRRFRRAAHAVDSTVIELVANCMPWAKHRRRKAAAKLHVRLNLQSLLPSCAIIKTAAEHDNTRAVEVCAGLQEGEIVIFDKAYVDFAHLADLSMRLIFWVTRAKDNLNYRVVRCIQKGAVGKILRDDLIRLKTPASRREYPELMRRIVALVEVDGREVEMVFLSNNVQWSAESIVELYRCRWQIEVFFKQIKQTLQLADFLGTSANAVRWQVWTALLTYLLLRYMSFLSDWSHSFSRLFTVIRACLWKKWDLLTLLRVYGTADGHFRYLARPEQAYFPGMG